MNISLRTLLNEIYVFNNFSVLRINAIESHSFIYNEPPIRGPNLISYICEKCLIDSFYICWELKYRNLYCDEICIKKLLE